MVYMYYPISENKSDFLMYTEVLMVAMNPPNLILKPNKLKYF
jgi:hypothetical protein